MKKRIPSVLLSAIVSVMCLMQVNAFAADKTPTYTGSSVPDHVALTWSSSPLTTQTVTWRTNEATADGEVQYINYSDKDSLGSSPKTKTVKASGNKFTSEDSQNMTIHTVTITGLTPGTKYAYRVGTADNYSNVFTFSTEKSNTNSFKFLVFGDSQSGDINNPNYLPWYNTVQKAYSANPDAKFMINVGDLVEEGQIYSHWNYWYTADVGVIDEIPEMAVQGNHETYVGTNWDTQKPKFYLSQFNLPQNGPEGLKGQTYSYDYGNVHVAVLDSQEEEEQPVAGDILAAQKTWLDNDLRSTSKQWKIVFFHKTPYYNKSTRTNEDIKAAFCPIFDKYHVDMVFNGHDHGLSRTYPIKNGKFVSSPSNGTVYYVTGRSGNKYYSDLSKKVWDAFFYDPQDTPCYEVVSVDGGKLNVSAYKTDGNSNILVDSYSIDKTTGKDSPPTAVPGKYNVTRLAIYGDVVNTQLSSTPVLQKDTNLWMVPLSSFVTFQGGTIAASSGGYTVSLNGKSYTIGSGNITNVNKVDCMSADNIASTFGYSYSYDDAGNILYFTK